jgi:hypothetical protein
MALAVIIGRERVDSSHGRPASVAEPLLGLPEHPIDGAVARGG